MGALSTAPFVGGVRAQSPTGKDGTSAQCVVRPQQTEGPYFRDERLDRSDIRSDPSDGAIKPGVPLRLEFHVSLIEDSACTPLDGAVVDLWQCDAQGVYSDVRDINGRFDTRGQRFLRGYQSTDADGIARFLTIYPGWYPGRTVHIHFKIRTDPQSQQGLEFTSQLYFDDAVTDRVHAQPPYADMGPRTVRNDRDGIFRRGGSHLMMQLTRDEPGYVGRFDIGLWKS
nr:intradiol ring-cleavage dioxygenase [Marinobacterium ramblicola]